jgi:hypothetical protein
MKRILFLAAVALVAFAGVAYAAGTITGKSIKDSTITGKDVKNKSLSAADFKGSVRGARGPAGATGPAGPAGPQGPAGPINAAGLTRVVGDAVIAPGDVGHATAFCPSGQQVIESQYESIAADGEVFYVSDFGIRNGISVGLDNFDSLVEGDVRAIAYCAPAGSAVIASSRRATLERRSDARDAQFRAAR